METKTLICDLHCQKGLIDSNGSKFTGDYMQHFKKLIGTSIGESITCTDITYDEEDSKICGVFSVGEGYEEVLGYFPLVKFNATVNCSGVVESNNVTEISFDGLVEKHSDEGLSGFRYYS
jgi:hypothetical protein